MVEHGQSSQYASEKGWLIHLSDIYVPTIRTHAHHLADPDFVLRDDTLERHGDGKGFGEPDQSARTIQRQGSDYSSLRSRPDEGLGPVRGDGKVRVVLDHPVSSTKSAFDFLREISTAPDIESA